MKEIHLEQFWFQLLRKNDIRELWHPELEIVFLLQGTARAFFSDLETAYTLREKDILVVNSFEVWNFEPDRDAVALSLMISPEFISNVTPELLKHRVNCRSFLYVEEKQSVFNGLRQKLAKAFRETYKMESGTTYSKSSAAAILEELGKYFLDEHQPVEHSGVLEAMKKVTRYMQQHYQEHLTLDELSKNIFLSKTYISRSFTKYLGISFTGYLELLRLSSAVRQLEGHEALTQIAEKSGFPNVNAMISAFKRYLGTTPGEYRRIQKSKGKEKQEKESLEEGSGLFNTLMCYDENSTSVLRKAECVQEVTVDTAKKKEFLSEHWKRLLNVGYARSLTDGRVQRELQYLQEKIGFEYLRVKGILDDDMCFLRYDMNGKAMVNYAYLDEGIDVILSLEAKPMLEIGFMSGLLAKDREILSMRGEVVSAPKNPERWKELIFLLMEHLVERYGSKSVEQWLIAPWISPDFLDMGFCGREEYEETYAASFHAIREVVPQAKIVGPCSAMFENVFSWYLNMCRNGNCMPDILSFRSFAIADEQEENELRLIENNESFSFAVSRDEDFLAHKVSRIRGIMKQYGLEEMPLIMDEWSNNIWQRDLCNDTRYKSAYLFKNILENNQHISAMGYFSLNDRLDEIAPSAETFHGGFGLFTQDGIPKSACTAMELLAQMGDKLLEQGDGYLVSQRGEEIQIFLYNYKHYDLLYRYRQIVNMSSTSREEVFVNQEPKAFYIRLKNLSEGIYQICRYGITQFGGSSYDAWVRMGAPSPLNKEEREMLKRFACPEYYSERMQTVEGTLHIKVSLAPQDVCFIRIKQFR